MATLTRWQPFSDFGQLDEMFDRAFGRRLGQAATPAIDVIRGEDRIIIKADMPGLSPEDVKIHVENGILTVSGEHQRTSETKEEHYVRRERSYGAFRRSMALPQGVDPDSIEATSKDGVVEVTIPLPGEGGKRVVEITPKAET